MRFNKSLDSKRLLLKFTFSLEGAGIIDGLIYVAGGAYGNTYHASLERFLIVENEKFGSFFVN
jgi:hypothetical protein